MTQVATEVNLHFFVLAGVRKSLKNLFFWKRQTCWISSIATFIAFVMSQIGKTAHIYFRIRAIVLFFSRRASRECWSDVSTEEFSCHRATSYESWGKWPLTLALRLLWLIRYSTSGSGALRAFPPKHRFTYWLWMGVILKHANAVSLGLYQLMQVRVVFGRDSKARGEKDVLRVRKGCINSSRITLPTFSMAGILWMDPLWGGSLREESKRCQDPVH